MKIRNFRTNGKSLENNIKWTENDSLSFITTNEGMMRMRLYV
jgi:hypothetical protein